MASVLATAFVKMEVLGSGIGKDIQSQLDAAGAGAAGAGGKAGSSWMTGFRKSDITKAANVISAAMAGAAIASVLMAAKFDAAMTRLNTQAGAARGQIGQLKAGVLQLAGQVGFAPDSLADSLYHVESNFASMGITSQKALSLVKVAAEGAAVGGADLTDVTNALTAAVASGIPGVSSFSQAMGMLNSIVGAGDMKMEDLSEAFGTGMVAVVKGYGLSLKDVGAALDVFGDNNIRGAQAGTELRMSVQALAVPAAAGADELKKLGLNSTSLAKAMQSGGLLPAMKLLVDRMNATGVSAKAQGDVITTIFGKKAGTGVAILADQMSRLESKYPALTKGADDFGKAWATASKTPAQKLKDLESAAEALAIELGNKLMPAAVALLGYLQGHVSVILKTAGAVGAMAVAISTLAKVIAVVQGAMKLWTVGTAIWAAVTDSSLVSGIALWVMYTLGVEAAGLATVIATGGIILILAALAIGILEIVKHWRDFKQWGMDAFHWVGKAASDVWDWIKGHWALLATILFGPIGLAVSMIIKHWDGVKHIFSDALDWVKGHWPLLATILFGPIGLAVSMIIKHWGQITGAFRDSIKAIEHVFDDIKSAITGGFDGWWKTHGKELQEVWHAIWAAMTAIFRAVWDPLAKFIKADWSAIETIFRVGSKVIGDVFRVALTIIENSAKASWDVISPIFKIGMAVIEGVFRVGWAIVSTVFKIAWAAISLVVKVAWDLIVAVFKIALDAIKAVLKIAWDIIVAIFSVALDLITGHWSTAWTDIKNVGVQIWHAISSFLGDTWTAIENAAKSTWNAITGFFKTVWSGLKTGFDDAISAIKSVWDTLSAVAEAPVKFVVNTIYDKGIVPVVNAIGSLIGLTLKPINFGAGGRVPGHGSRDDVPALLTPGERVLSNDQVRRLGGHGILDLLVGRGSGGGGRYGGGGIIGDITSGIGDVLGGLTGLVGSAAAAVASKILDPLLAGMPGGGTVLGEDIKKIPVTMIASVIKAITGTGGGGGAGGGSGGFLGGPGGGAPAANAALAKTLMPAWAAGTMWAAWNSVAMRESGWSNTARNASSGAYGIPQALPPSKMGAAANPPESNPTAQIRWMISYIQGRYNNPQGAWAHELSAGWYGSGGQINEPIWGRGLMTGRGYRFGESGPETVTSGGAGTRGAGPTARQIDRLIAAMESAAASSAATAGALGGMGTRARQAGSYRTR